MGTGHIEPHYKDAQVYRKPSLHISTWANGGYHKIDLAFQKQSDLLLKIMFLVMTGYGVYLRMDGASFMAILCFG